MENATVINCVQPLLETTKGDNSSSNVTTTAEPIPDQNDALFYIITVLMFYACSIVILMIKYIRRERQEAEFSNYYYEFVSRDKFQQPQYQNFQQVCHVMKSLRSGGKNAGKILPRDKPPDKSDKITDAERSKPPDNSDISDTSDDQNTPV